MRTVYMALGPESFDEVKVNAARHDAVVMPYAMARANKDKLAGLPELYLHVPACYGRPGVYQGDFFDPWYQMADKCDGWLMDPQGQPVYSRWGDRFFDLRIRWGAEQQIARLMADILAAKLVEAFVGAQDQVRGLFVDCTWDEMTPMGSGYTTKDDQNWKRGTWLFLNTLKTRLPLVALVGNGWCASPALDAEVVEGFPRDPWWMYRNNVRRYCYEKDVWMLPMGASRGVGITEDDALQAWAFGMTYTNGTPALCMNDLSLVDWGDE